eukprot:TRINITY_DN446_c0_g1_i2.p1 TRINITY_DN446_c0_g1~~TRINITY_DN446_c0_g1_i2.p1  ORF type:complete len:1063 (+),score=252.76 TRINITY_DN446_c0_g1_i2:671-3859(+)
MPGKRSREEDTTEEVTRPKRNHRDGSITQIKLKNFMVLSDVGLSPAPGLNLILGPNATGKSSIVSAVCLGLAGKPNLLMRAGHVKDYIQTGKPLATIEIELCQTRGNSTLITRNIKTDGSSLWMLNGRSKPESEIAALVHKFNIHLDNLTQFLPQERLKSFSGLNPQKLLEATEEAILPQEILVLHKDLKTQRVCQIDFEKSLALIVGKLTKLEEENRGMEKEVERLQQRRGFLRKAAEFALMVPRARFIALQVEGRKVKQDVDDASTELKAFAAKIQPIDEECTRLDTERKSLEGKLTNCEGRMKQLQKTLESEASAKISRELDGLEEEDEKLNDREQYRVREIEKKKQELEMLQAQDTDFAVPAQEKTRLQEHIQQTQKAHSAKKLELAQKDIEMEEKRAMLAQLGQDIAALSNVRAQRLEVLAKKDSSIKKVYKWVQEQTAQKNFKGRVYLVALEVNVTTKNSEHATYIETAIPEWLRKAFVCEDRADQELLRKEFFENAAEKPRFSTIHRPPTQTDLPDPICDVSQLAQFGITHTLDTVFEAPAAVFGALLDNVALGRMLCGSKGTNPKDMEQILALAPKASVIFTPTDMYRCVRSRYSRELSTRVFRLRPPEIFSGVNNVSELSAKQEAEKQIKLALVALDGEKTDVRRQEQLLRKELEQFKQQLTQLELQAKEAENTKCRIANKQKELAQLLKQADLSNERKRIKDRMKKLNDLRVEGVEKHTTCLGDQLTTLNEIIELTLRREVLLMTLRATEQEKREHTAELARLKKAYTEVKAKWEQTEHRLKELLAQWNESKRKFMQEWEVGEEELTRITASYNDLSSTELEARRRNEEAAAEAIHGEFADEIMREYTNRQAEIATVTGEKEQAQARLDALNHEMEAKKQEWLSPLRDLVTRLDETFSEFCRYVGIQGQVRLEEKGNDFADYEIALLVKFRDEEQQQRLDQHRQSGGERSVVTVLYILALHSLSDVCPLRVVDEMDQGMDEPNRRRVFRKMLEASNMKDAPQSFLLTPKLLPGLVPDEPSNLDVFLIFNGPHAAKQADWDQTTLATCHPGEP